MEPCSALTLLGLICVLGCYARTNVNLRGHDEGDEESSIQFTKYQTYDITRNRPSLIPTWDAEKDAFIGSVG